MANGSSHPRKMCGKDCAYLGSLSVPVGVCPSCPRVNAPQALLLTGPSCSFALVSATRMQGVAVVMVAACRRAGQRSSGLLFIFWGLMVVCGLPQLKDIIAELHLHPHLQDSLQVGVSAR
ncbi:hypothetical protein E2C01_088068 [Portunus trituberculatus]|uniref:Uncharacterized protein n=1 Tax=Portunus trituberculatus TaxID=210409 RepID=A0A5B7JEZ1_PORTR|nr:hypothetical protein [Portunus trituberculatus]